MHLYTGHGQPPRQLSFEGINRLCIGPHNNRRGLIHTLPYKDSILSHSYIESSRHLYDLSRPVYSCQCTGLTMLCSPRHTLSGREHGYLSMSQRSNRSSTSMGSHRSKRQSKDTLTRTLRTRAHIVRCMMTRRSSRVHTPNTHHHTVTGIAPRLNVLLTDIRTD